MRKKELLFATSNEGKIREARYVLSPLGFEIRPIEMDFDEPITGSISEIALHKLHQVLAKGMTHVFVEDSGIFFDAYHQFPGILSKRVFQGIGYRGIEKLLMHESKKAWFEGAIAAHWQGAIKVFSAKTFGHLFFQSEQTLAPESGLPFDPIFVPEGENCVLQQLPYEQRIKHSYRRKALVKMAHWMDQQGVKSIF